MTHQNSHFFRPLLPIFLAVFASNEEILDRIEETLERISTGEERGVIIIEKMWNGYELLFPSPLTQGLPPNR
jgi:hypothetical protein